MASAPANDFLERLNRALDFKPIEKALQAMYSATTGCPPNMPTSKTRFGFFGPQQSKCGAPVH